MLATPVFPSWKEKNRSAYYIWGFMEVTPYPSYSPHQLALLPRACLGLVFYLHSFSRLLQNTYSMPGAMLDTGPEMKGEQALPSRSYHFHNYSFDHRAGNSKRKSPKWYSVAGCGQKRIFCIWAPERQTVVHTGKSTHGLVCEYRKGGRAERTVGSPGSQIQQEAGRHKTPKAMKQCQHQP